jgi:hypothetical protein
MSCLLTLVSLIPVHGSLRQLVEGHAIKKSIFVVHLEIAVLAVLGQGVLDISLHSGGLRVAPLNPSEASFPLVHYTPVRSSHFS